jgi:UDP-N-acetylmuramate dehydrogenase
MRCLERKGNPSQNGRGASEEVDVSVERNEPLSRHSSLRIGGPASLWVEAETERELRCVLDWAVRKEEEVYVVGLGSNALFPDEGIDGIVVRLTGGLADWRIERESGESAIVRVGGGTVNAHLVRGLLDAGWIGAEFLRLVPGTFGGAVAMNAGTKEAELASILVETRLVSVTRGGLEERTCGPDALELDYRDSNVERDEIVVEGWVCVRAGGDDDVDAAREKMERDRERRDETQPYKLASAGSTFANPEGDYAGRLIDAAGLKGASVGDARISPMHANFFINDGDATAEDVLALMARARREVREQFGVELRPEIDFVGFDGLERLRELEARKTSGGG